MNERSPLVIDDDNSIWVDCKDCGVAVPLCPDDDGYHNSSDVLCSDCAWFLADDDGYHDED